MAFLTVNDVTIPVMNDSVGMSYFRIGGEYSTENGALICTTGKPAKLFSFTTTPQTLTEAQAWKAWIFGQNLYWGFNQEIYSKYTGYTLDEDKTDPGWTYSTTTAKFAGEYYGSFSSFTKLSQFEVTRMNWKMYEPYTVGLFLYIGGAWHHYLVTSFLGATLGISVATGDTLQAYIDGVAQGTFNGYVYPNVTDTQQNDGSLTVHANANWITGSSTTNRAEYVLFKGAHLTQTMISALSARTTKLVGYPYVEMSGDILNGDTMTVVGRLDSEEFLWGDNEQKSRLTFSLIEANQNPLEVLTT